MLSRITTGTLRFDREVDLAVLPEHLAVCLRSVKASTVETKRHQNVPVPYHPKHARREPYMVARLLTAVILRQDQSDTTSKTSLPTPRIDRTIHPNAVLYSLRYGSDRTGCLS